jgi:proteic killer suppression protein
MRAFGMYFFCSVTTGRDKGRYAVNASGNWRITFGWGEGDATDVDLEDYH